MFAHLNKQPYPTGHSEISSLFLKTPFWERSGAIGLAGVSSWLGGVIVVGFGSNPDGAQLVFLYYIYIYASIINLSQNKLVHYSICHFRTVFVYFVAFSLFFFMESPVSNPHQTLHYVASDLRLHGLRKNAYIYIFNSHRYYSNLIDFHSKLFPLW